METLRAFLSGCMAFLSFSSPKGSAEALPEVFSSCKTCRRRRTQPIPAESGDYLHFLNGFAKSLVRERADQRVAFHACYAVRTRCLAIYGSCVRRRPRVDGYPSRPNRSASREQPLDCSRRLAPKENSRRGSGGSLACFAVGGSAAHGRF